MIMKVFCILMYLVDPAPDIDDIECPQYMLIMMTCPVVVEVVVEATC